MRSLFFIGIVALVGCDAGKKQQQAPIVAREAPLRIAFGDCSTSDAPFVSGPRPLASAERVPNRPVPHPVYDAGSGSAVPRPAMPTTTLGQPALSGGVDKAKVRQVVKRDIQKIMYCYERRLLDKPALLGTVDVQFTIAASGEVTQAAAAGVDPDISSCVETVFKALKFPATHAATQVNYPITFRPAGGDATPAVPSASGSAHGQMPERPVASEPGATSPLRAQRAAIESCVRGAGLASGVFVAELAFSGAEAKLAVEADDPKLAACIQAIKVLRPPGEAAHERCGVAFGAGGPVSVPAIAITADEVTFGGKVVDQVANVTGDDRFDQSMPLTEALNSWAKVRTAKVAITGVGMIEPIDATPMKVVNHVMHSSYAAQLELVLARQRGATWQPLREVVTPVPPIARGTGGSWNDASHGVKGDDDGERVELSLYVTPEQIWVGVSRINEFQEVVGRDWATLGAALRERKASAFFADRTDVELAGDDTVTYGDLLHALDIAAEAGFVDWRVVVPGALTAKPEL